jgi:hypothetical protein
MVECEREPSERIGEGRRAGARLVGRVAARANQCRNWRRCIPDGFGAGFGLILGACTVASPQKSMTKFTSIGTGSISAFHRLIARQIWIEVPVTLRLSNCFCDRSAFLPSVFRGVLC